MRRATRRRTRARSAFTLDTTADARRRPDAVDQRHVDQQRREGRGRLHDLGHRRRREQCDGDVQRRHDVGDGGRLGGHRRPVGPGRRPGELGAPRDRRGGQHGVGQTGAAITLDTTAPTIAISVVTGDNTINNAEATAGFNISGTTDAEDGQTGDGALRRRGDRRSPRPASLRRRVPGRGRSMCRRERFIDDGDGVYRVTADVSDRGGQPRDAGEPERDAGRDRGQRAVDHRRSRRTARGGINADEASNGTPVVMSLTGTLATAGDTLTVNWGGQTVNYTLLADDITNGSATVTVTCRRRSRLRATARST